MLEFQDRVTWVNEMSREAAAKVEDPPWAAADSFPREAFVCVLKSKQNNSGWTTSCTSLVVFGQGLESAQDQSVDLVFIDGDHSYEAVVVLRKKVMSVSLAAGGFVVQWALQGSLTGVSRGSVRQREKTKR